MELDEAELLVPFFQYLSEDLSDEDLAAAIGGLALEIKLRILTPLLSSLGPEEWAIIGKLMDVVLDLFQVTVRAQELTGTGHLPPCFRDGLLD